MITLPPPLTVIPRPLNCSRGAGYLTFNAAKPVTFPDSFAFEAGQLSAHLIEAGVSVGELAGEAARILFLHDEADPEHLGQEGYVLQIDPNGVEIRAATATGAFYAAQTIRQMLPAPKVPGGEVRSITLPHLLIVDRPKFPWRGMLFDVSRHFFSVKEIKGIVDLLAFHNICFSYCVHFRFLEKVCLI